MKKSRDTYIIDKISGETSINSSSFIQTSNRRDFLKSGTMAACAAMLPKALVGVDNDKNQFPEDQQKYIIEARYYEKLPYRKIRCKLCPGNVS